MEKARAFSERKSGFNSSQMLEQNFSAIFDESLVEQNVWRHILAITLSMICGAILGFEGFTRSRKVTDISSILIRLIRLFSKQLIMIFPDRF